MNSLVGDNFKQAARFLKPRKRILDRITGFTGLILSVEITEYSNLQPICKDDYPIRVACHCERPSGARQSLTLRESPRLLRHFVPRNDTFAVLIGYTFGGILLYFIGKVKSNAKQKKIVKQ